VRCTSSWAISFRSKITEQHRSKRGAPGASPKLRIF
jgi:hypothetical protein